MRSHQYLLAEGEVELNAGRAVTRIQVTNTGDRAVQVGSHYHFFEVNRALRFDRRAALGMRLDVPAGTAVRFEPGDSRSVDLVPFAGARVVRGFSALIAGPLDSTTFDPAMARARARGFAGADEPEG